MLPLKTILYLALFFPAILGTIIYHPVIGILAYLFTYNINPLTHWWAHYLPGWAVRYSLILATATALGILIQRSKLRFHRFLDSQEILLLLFLALIWLSVPLGLGREGAQSNVIKMTKVFIILMMATHLITDLKRYEAVIWVLIVAGLYLGIETYSAPEWLFYRGRLDSGIGGSDFGEGNFLAAHFAMVLPLMGVMFLKSGWKMKLLCLASGVFTVNSIILVRSRGIFLAAMVGAFCAVIFAKKEIRKKVLLGMLVGLIGAAYLTDPGFWRRMEQIDTHVEQMDTASRGRLQAWKAAWAMFSDHPLGVGEGNFKRMIGQYNPDMSGRDTHNTFLRCLAELGFQGLFVLLLLIVNAFRILSLISKEVAHLKNKNDFLWHIYAVRIALIVYVVAGLFITHTYIEELYWLLMFPVFLKRSVENEVYAAQTAKV